MKIRFSTFLLFCLLFAVSLTSCFKKSETDSRLKVGVTLAPQAWLAQQIGGNEVVVTTLLAPGVSPETFDPSPRDMADIFGSDLFFVAGFAFERHIIEKMASKNQNVMIDPSESLPLRKFAAYEGHHHSHDHNEDGHSDLDEGNLDPHFWFSIKHMRHHAKVMSSAMAKARPAQAAQFNQNLEKTMAILDGLQAEAETKLSQYKGKSFLVFHPTYGYLAAEFGLEQVAIEVEGKEPTPKQLTEITKAAKEHQIMTIIVQPQFPFSAASAIADAINGKVVVVDSLSADYENMYRRLVETIAVSFKDGAKSSNE